MITRSPRSTRTDTLFPYTTLFRSAWLKLGNTDRDLRLYEVGQPRSTLWRRSAGLSPNASKGPATRSEPVMETMPSQTIHVVGSCRCGGIQLEITAAPLLTMACHCVGCQKMTASAFSLSAAIPTQGFRVTSGEPVIGGLHGTARHYFCPFA